MFLSIVIFILTLLILVVIHEAGHFLVAKKFGIKVLEFGFGIPPMVWGKKIGETIYSINWLPFGGFVRLLGEDEETSLKNKKGVKNDRDFRAKPVGIRIAVVIAGVVMNLFLAWVLFYIVIIGQNFNIIYPVPEQGVFIAEVEKGFPAESAGIRLGDKLLSVDNQPTTDIEKARQLIKSKQGGSVTLTLADSDGNNIRQVNVTPKKVENNVLIGVIFSPIPFRQYTTFSEKLFSGITYSWDLTKLTFSGFGTLISQLFTGHFGQVSKSVTGPVGMATITNEILSTGGTAVIFPYLWFVGIISLTLSIFNVLPIPALDGGRLLFLVIEAITRKKVKEDIERMVHQVGFLILLALAVLVTFSDIRKLLP